MNGSRHDGPNNFPYSGVGSSSSSLYRKDDNKPPARRMRKALSCTQCKDRKIKCDRNVPGCSSCVVRGIERTCRWGDERDDDTKLIRSSVAAPGNKEGLIKRSLDASANGKEVDEIVEQVMKRLKRDRDLPSVSSTASSPHTSSRVSLHASDEGSMASQMVNDILSRNIRPPRYVNALIRPITAFSGASIYHPLYAGASEGDVQLSAEQVRQTLRCLPAKEVCQDLIETVLRELLYYRCVFNIVILREQLKEFWDGVEELGVKPVRRSGLLRKDHKLHLADVGTLASLATSGAQTPIADSPNKDKSYFLCSRIRQGLIGLVFAILDTAGRSLNREVLQKYGIVSSTENDDSNIEFSETMNEFCVYHLNSSNYGLQPTLWTLQALYLSQGRWLNIRTAGRSMASRGAMVSLAVSMGLNLLGNTYDDLDNMEVDEEGNVDLTKSTFSGITWHKDVELERTKDKGPNLLTDSRYTASLVVFEGQSLALRELGRKIWCSIAVMDWIIAGHLDHYYSIHDGISHTAPPVPVDDADILSPHAPLYLAKARMGTHKPSQAENVALNFALARATRTQTDLENSKGFPLPYQDILMLDGLITQVMDAMPASLRIKKANFWEQTYGPAMAAKIDKRDMSMQTAMLQDQIHFRRLRLHRQYFGQGLKDARYRASVDACLLAARMILEARIEVEEHKMLMFSGFVMQSHLFHAALVFQLSLLYELDRRREVEKKKASRRSTYDADDDRGTDTFMLVDFDQTLKRLQKAVDYLRRDAQGRMTTDLLPGLDAFLQGVQDLKLDQKGAAVSDSNGTTSEQARRRAAAFTTNERDLQHADAANILASIPSIAKDQSPAQRNTPPSVSSTTMSDLTSRDHWAINSSSTPSTSSFYPSSHYPAAQQQHSEFQAATSNLEGWSLEALVPDYAAGTVDLFEALERSFFGGNNTGGGVVNPESVTMAQSILNVPLSIDAAPLPFPAITANKWYDGVANS